MPINADKPQLWKADVERSIDFYNDWFIRFAPETYRAQRRITTVAVLDALAEMIDDDLIAWVASKEKPTKQELARAATVVADRMCGAYSNPIIRNAQERRESAPFLATYMGRSNGNRECPIRFFVNLSDAIVTNVFLNLYPTAELAVCLDSDAERLIELGVALNNVPAESILHAGRAYGGGLHKIEPKELLEVQLASAPAWVDDALTRQLVLV